MKWILLLAFASFHFVAPHWHTDLDTAKKEARENSHLILLNFSGSDWCGPCIRLREEVFNSETFLKLADSSLVLCNADFPRGKKNQLPAEQQKKNESLAEQYNPYGKFPYTVLLSADGKLLKGWEGYPQSNKQSFIDQIKAACDANARQ
ncbi:thioredoxin family protein [Pseudoflavitalea rhizosphaerae]|uniref:thioredoxin family protein n=1 Tax=Pseudoflavitalea rhizosphaerae TaxID=1884793 RepID=UPI000F8F81D8|nr:thioredoxin family protein [Pseudoflavitalea rhizosphaerae]